MMKQAWRSYLTSLHPRNIKTIREKNPVWWVFPLVMGVNILPALLSDETPQAWMWSYFFLLFPVAFMTWSDFNSKYLMSKQMFLCPMKKEEREEYIYCVIKCKIFGALIVGFIVHFIWSLKYGFYMWRLMTLLFLYASAGIAIYMGYENPTKTGKKDPWVIYDKDGKAIYPWLSTLLFCTVFAEVAVFAFLDFKPEVVLAKTTFPFFVAGASILLLAIVILDIAIIKGQFPYITENIGDYEKNFKITQVKKPVQVKYDLFEKKR